MDESSEQSGSNISDSSSNESNINSSKEDATVNNNKKPNSSSSDDIFDQSIGSDIQISDTIKKEKQTVFTPITLEVAKSNATAYMSTLASKVSVTDITSVNSAISNSDNYRLAKLFEKTLKGQNITIATIGGSVTNASYIKIEEQKYANLIKAWFEATFPNIEVTLVNAGIGSTSSAFGLYRLKEDVLIFDPDLIVIEFSVNDTNHDYLTKTYEGLLRSALSQEEVAVVPLYFAMKNKRTAQSNEQPISDHYKLPQASLLDAFNGYSDWDSMFWDDVHPNNRGHGRAALVFNQLLTTALNNYKSAQMGYTIPKAYYDDAAIYGNDYLVKLQYGNEKVLFLTNKVVNNNAIDMPLTDKITLTSAKYFLKEDNKKLANHTFDVISVNKGDTLTFTIKDIRSFLIIQNLNPDLAKATVTVTEGGSGKETVTNLESYYGSSSILWNSEPLYKSSDSKAHTVTVSIKATSGNFCFAGFGLTD